jgi:hypothetical protein
VKARENVKASEMKNALDSKTKMCEEVASNERHMIEPFHWVGMKTTRKE